MGPLASKKGLIIGVANEHSIAHGCATAFRAQGADLALTYLNDKARPHVAPLARALDAELLLPLDASDDATIQAVFDAIERHWGRLDFLLHSIAFCPKEDLHAPITESSRDGFLMAMDISCHSFLRMMRLGTPLMRDGGTCLTVSYFGAERVMPHYNVMGPVKAALEAAVRYAAVELGPKNITVHALSPGPLKTRAASGIDHFDDLIESVASRSPQHRLAEIEDVGAYAAFLVGDGARRITGGIHYVDAGFNITG